MCTVLGEIGRVICTNWQKTNSCAVKGKGFMRKTLQKSSLNGLNGNTIAFSEFPNKPEHSSDVLVETEPKRTNILLTNLLRRLQKQTLHR